MNEEEEIPMDPWTQSHGQQQQYFSNSEKKKGEKLPARVEVIYITNSLIDVSLSLCAQRLLVRLIVIFYFVLLFY